MVGAVAGINALHQLAWEVAVFHAETARAVAVAHESALLAAECAGIAARALRAMGRRDEAEARREQAESGFRQLGATSLLERLQQDLRG
jgi:hypothetical protein